MKLGEMIDLLVDQYFQLAGANMNDDEWAANQHRGHINSIRSALNDFYTPEQMVKVEAMIDERVEASFA